MNNKKRPVISDNTLKRRYSRRINAISNNAEASLDDCVDDIILSIASYLTSCELLKLALTCKRFGARSTVSDDDEDEQQDEISETNGILSNGSTAFARPSTNGTRVLHSNYHQELPSNERNRKVMFHEGVIIEHSFATESYRIEFVDKSYLKSRGNNKQWVHQTEVISIEDMTTRVEQSLRFCVKKVGGTICVSHYIMVDKQRWGIRPSFIKVIGSSSLERSRVQLENKDWSLMEEAALQKALCLLPKDGCLMWRERESWMGICHQLQQELELLEEAGNELEREQPLTSDQTGWCKSDLNQYLNRRSDWSSTVENELAETWNRIISRNNTNEDILEECHKRGAVKLISLYENGVGGILMDCGMKRRIQTVLLIAHLRSMKVGGPYVIVAPLSLVPHWVTTFNQYTDISVACLVGTQEEREVMYSGRLNKSLYVPSGRRSKKYPVIITSYEEAIKSKQQLNTVGGPDVIAEFTHFIVEEGEGFERYRCALLSCLEHNRSVNRLFLPASPINCAKDMLRVLHFLFGNMFESEEFLSIVTQYAYGCDKKKRHPIEAKLRTILNVFTIKE